MESLLPYASWIVKTLYHLGLKLRAFHEIRRSDPEVKKHRFDQIRKRTSSVNHELIKNG